MQNKFLIFIVTLTFSSFLFAKEKNTDKFQKPIKKHLSEIQACSGQSAKAIVGKVVVDLEINDNSSVQRIKINDQQTTMTDLSVQKCIVDILKNVKFPKAAKGKTEAFSFTTEYLTQ